MTKPESQTGDGAEGFILCPDCGANVVAPVQSALADNPEYKEAKNIHMGLHSWRVYLKKKAFLVLGFVTWYHDLIDGVVKNLCAQAGETVDSATQSFSWRWTIGWFSGPTPEVSEHITKAYNWFSFVSTVLLWAGFLWLTRWSYFTQKMENFEGNKVKENTCLALTWFFRGLVWWLFEYVVIGLIMRFLCRDNWPPVVPTLTSNLIFFSAFAMCLCSDAAAAFRRKSNT